MDSAATTLHIVCHTHWDREWYEPFQSFRLRLVDALDELLEILEAEPALRFLLDGQTAMLDDYLAVRPEREADIRRFAAQGRLSIGPLVALPDELLVSGETLVRNLQRGRRRAAEVATPMPVAYLPDMFGHTAQMPQLLVLSGLDRAVVWRGVPASVDRTLFRWQAPDGSEVLVAYLASSYSNAVALPTDPEALASRAQALVEEQAQFSPPGHVLAMCGTDHWPPQRGLTSAVASLASTAPEGSAAPLVRISSLEDYFAAVTADLATDTLPQVSGEMRSGRRANVLMGVTSTRVDLKGLQARAEATLERIAEPLAAIAGYPIPPALADLAWSNLVLNSAHDSVCSCSSDETMTSVSARYEETLQVASGIAARALRALSTRVADDRLGDGEHAVLVWNPSPFPRSEVITLEVPVHWDTTEAEPRPAWFEAPDGTMVAAAALDWAAEVMADLTLTGDQVMGYLPLLHSREFGDVFVNSVDVTVDDDTVEVVLRAEPEMRGHLDAEALKTRVVELVEENPTKPFHVQLTRLPTQRVLARTPPLEPLGWMSLRAVPADVSAGTEAPDAVSLDVGEQGIVLDNGLVRVTVADDGTFSLADSTCGVEAHGLCSLVDGGDAGDTYNWSPPPVDLFVDRPVSVAAAPVESSSSDLPRRSVVIERRYYLPAGLADGDTARSEDRVVFDVETTLTVTAGERRVDVELAFDNTARDHRLRAHFPLPEQATGSTADAAFCAVRRSLDAEGGTQELPLATWPFRRFADASGTGAGLTLFTEQVLEYEVSGGGENLAVTLARATGFLSRSHPMMRPNAAGPILAVRHAQAFGPQRIRLGVIAHGSDWTPASAAAEADRFATPLQTITLRANAASADLPATGAPFAFDADPSVALSALRGELGEGIELRLVNLGTDTAMASIRPQEWFAAQWATSDVGAVSCDLTGTEMDGASGGELELGPWQIRTLQWRPAR